EALVEEEAFERVSRAAERGELGEALGEGEGQRERGEEALAAGERLHRPAAVRVPVVEDEELLGLAAERVAALRELLEVPRAVLGEDPERFFLDVGEELVCAQ